MTTQTRTDLSTQVYQIYIKATPQAIWDAITKPEWTTKYAYRCESLYELRPGGAFKSIANEGMRAVGLPEVVVDGEVLEADPPHKLVQTWRFHFSEENIAEGFARLTYEVAEAGPGISSLTVVHDQLENAPLMAAAVASPWRENAGGGWSWILSDLKSLLETGKTLDE